MSGLKHYTGDSKYQPDGSEGEGAAVSFPAIGGNDRELVIEAITLSAWGRGLFDGKYVSRLRDFPAAVPVSPAHIKLHAQATLKAMAADITACGLTAAQCLKHYIAGFDQGYKEAWGGQSLLMGDPDAQ